MDSGRQVEITEQERDGIVAKYREKEGSFPAKRWWWPFERKWSPGSERSKPREYWELRDETRPWERPLYLEKLPGETWGPSA